MDATVLVYGMVWDGWLTSPEGGEDHRQFRVPVRRWTARGGRCAAWVCRIDLAIRSWCHWVEYRSFPPTFFALLSTELLADY